MIKIKSILGEKELKQVLGCALPGTLLLALAGVLGRQNHFIPAFAIIVFAIASYFYIALFPANRNWLDLRALFSGVWLGTLGLAGLRLAEYQEPWLNKTWVLFAIAYCLFMVGMTVGILVGRRAAPGFVSKLKRVKLGKLRFIYKKDRLFSICVITTLIGLGCFIANVLIKGYIPCFSDDPMAYATFYTKFHMFAIAAGSVSGLCYYTLTTQKLHLWKKIALVLCILYLVFIFPILIVSRAIFATSALSLATVVFYRHKKKLWVLVVCIAVMLGTYLGVSFLRGYTNAQLDAYFEPATIVIDRPDNKKDPTENTSETTDTTPDNPQSPVTFTLSPKTAFLYSYLTVSHDNFNEVVQNLTGYTYGARQFRPFNVLCRIDALDELATSAGWYCVRPHLPTVSLLGDAYYDFHEVGVILFAIFWSVAFGLIQSFHSSTGDPFSLLVLGNTMTPIVMCFFECWMGYFPHWMLWGTALIYMFAATVALRPKKENQ